MFNVTKLSPQILKKLVVASGMTIALATGSSAFAKDALDGSVWKVVNEKGKSDALIKIVKQGDVFIGKMHKNLTKNKICTDCKGKYKNKDLVGVPLITKVKAEGKGKYGGGYILDPTLDKNYKVKLELIDNNQKLKVRGYIGTPLLGDRKSVV